VHRPLSASHGRTTLVAAATLFATLAVLVLAKSALAWSTEKYADAVLMPGGYTISTAGQADRLWNRIWRPTPRSFCSHYPPYLTSYVCSTWDNPLSDERDAFNSWAHCMNNSAADSYPTTCQTTRP
jgi:hypothetical protein